jgi:epoxide hydrolase-like predicted phosphatase
MCIRLGNKTFSLLRIEYLKGEYEVYRNIIFDLGNVLLNFKPKEYLRTKITETDRIAEVHNELYQSEEWLMLDRGTITEEEAKAVLIRNSKRNGDLIELAFDNWYVLFTPIEGSIRILKALRNAGYKVYYLSNFHLLAFEYVIKNYDFFKCFDGGVVSYEEKLIKPEEGIYRRILDKYQIKPEESIFVDDVEANVEGARRLNFRTIRFQHPEQLKDDLRSCGIHI